MKIKLKRKGNQRKGIIITNDEIGHICWGLLIQPGSGGAGESSPFPSGRLPRMQEMGQSRVVGARR